MQFVLLVVVASAAFFGRNALAPLQEAMRNGLRLSDNQIALLQGPALALPVIAGAIPIGVYVDTRCRTRLVRLCLLALLAGNLIIGLASQFFILVLARSFVGLAAQTVWITATSILADLVKIERRGRGFTFLTFGQLVAAAAAFWIGGLLLSYLSPAGNWRLALLWLCLPVVICLFLAFALREPTRKERVEYRSAGTRAAMTELWRYRRVVIPITAGVAMADIAAGADLIWTAPMLLRIKAMSPELMGTVIGIVTITAGILGSASGGLLADRSQRTGGPRRTVTCLIILTLLSLPTSLYPLVPNGIMSALLLLLFRSLHIAVGVIAAALLTVVIPNELRGLCASILAAVAFLFGLALAPLIVSELSSWLGGSTTIGVALAAVCAVSTVCSLVVLSCGRHAFPTDVS